MHPSFAFQAQNDVLKLDLEQSWPFKLFLKIGKNGKIWALKVGEVTV